ncbi:MAG: ATP-binding cassette domain-containing protein, partial [Candidatus Nanopelagicales bacterium]
VLDEPTSALDPGAAEEVLAALQRLVYDLGVTVLMSEHRLERVIHTADRVVVIPGDGGPLRVGTPAQMMVDSPVAPPVVELGRLASWSPLPLSIRDARRAAGPLRERLATMPAPSPAPRSTATTYAFTATEVVVRFGPVTALNRLSLRASRGEVLALMGRNGAGKSTLLGALVGLLRPAAGSVRLGTVDPATLRGRDLVHHVGLVPQQPTDLLVADRVDSECAASDTDAGATAGTTREILDRLAPGIRDQTHPRDLSEGQRLALALSVVLAAAPPLVLLDEPTRGLDYPSKRLLGKALRQLASQGHCIVLATHDVELAAEVATRVAVIADGELVADGPAASIVVGSPMFAPQVAKVLSPLPWLTVTDVAAALAGAS